MELIPLKVWNRIDMLKQPIAARVDTSDKDTSRWVSIHYSYNDYRTLPPHVYYVADTIFSSELLARYAPDGDEDLTIMSKTEHYVQNIDELYALLSGLGIAPHLFNAPWHVGHPLL